MPTQYQPMNIPALFMAAQQMRLGKQQEQQNQLQLSGLMEDRERQQKSRAALEADDFATYAKYDPQGAIKIQESRQSLAKTKLGMAKDAQEISTKRTAENRAFQQNLLSAMQAGAPIEVVRKTRDDAVASGNYDHFDLPGEDRSDLFNDVVPNEVRPNDITVAQRMAGVAPPTKPGSVLEFEYAKDHPDYDAREIALATAKSPKTNISVGGKDLPAGQVNELADYQTAIQSLDTLQESFRKLVPSDSTFDQIVSRAKSAIPNTPEAQYGDAVLAAQQVIGYILENGKLVGQDEAKYRAMLPKAGDSFETVRMKVNNVKQLLLSKGGNRGLALQSSGYRKPTKGTAQSPSTGIRPGVEDLFNKTKSP